MSSAQAEPGAMTRGIERAAAIAAHAHVRTTNEAAPWWDGIPAKPAMFNLLSVRWELHYTGMRKRLPGAHQTSRSTEIAELLFTPRQSGSTAECVAACAATNSHYSKMRAAVGLAPRRRPARTGLKPVRIARLLGMLHFSCQRGLFAPASLDFPRRRTVRKRYRLDNAHLAEGVGVPDLPIGAVRLRAAKRNGVTIGVR